MSNDLEGPAEGSLLREVHDAGALLNAIISTSSDGVLVVDNAGRVVFASKRMGDLVAADGRDLIAVAVSDIVSLTAGDFGSISVAPEAPVHVEGQVLRSDGSRFTASISVARADQDDGLERVAVLVRDTSHLKMLQEQLERHALHDQLTGLANRAFLIDQIAQSGLRGSGACLVAMDIDNFARVNQLLGHAAGDELLTSIGQRLRTIHPGAVAARLGGDRFALLVPSVRAPDVAAVWAQRCTEVVSESESFDGHSFHMTASAGVAVDGGGGGADQLLRSAEAALDEAKRTQLGRPLLFTDKLATSMKARFAIESELRDAISGRELRVQYQPVVRLEDGVPVGVEALVRWQHPRDGLLPPSAFLPYAEESELISGIGNYVLSEACDRAAEWQRDLPEVPFAVSVNVAARQLADGQFVSHVKANLRRSGVRPGLIQLEITEASVIADVATASSTLRRLKALGVSLALDDFGTGYSSLAYLKRFPFDVVKIDKSFVDGLGRHPEDAAIVRTVIDLSRALGMRVVAEGVESNVQRTQLLSMDCSYGQGFLWHRPVDADVVPDLRRVSTTSASHTPVRRASGARASDELGGAATAVTHELRQPLAVIAGYAELLAEMPDDPSRTKQYADALVRGAKSMQAIVETVMEADQADRGMLSIVAREVGLEEVAAAAAERARRYLSAGRELRLEVSGHMRVLADLDRVAQIMDNVITNADRYSPSNLPIDIRATEVDDQPAITVRDYGDGVADEDVAFVFRKFARLQSGGKGSGLGLYISRAIARAHGGDLRYRHAPGGGAEFVLSLPRATTSQGTAATPRAR